MRVILICDVCANRVLSIEDPDDVLLLDPPSDAVNEAEVLAMMEKAKLLKKLAGSLQLLERATGQALGRQRLADHAQIGEFGGTGLLSWGTAERDNRSGGVAYLPLSQMAIHDLMIARTCRLEQRAH